MRDQKTTISLLIYHLLCVCFINFSLADTVSNDRAVQLFEDGNRFYQEGEYLNALESYQKILEMGYESGQLYYNLGNVYYKLNNIGHAILHYERAKRIIPSNEDLKANLALANLSVVDKFEEPPQFILSRIMKNLINLFPKSILIPLVLGLYTLFMISMIYWILQKRRMLRQVGLRIMTGLGLCLFIFIFLLIGQLREDRLNREAIIIVDKIEVLSAPSERGGVEIFSLHQGTKVRLDQMADDWVEIICPDRKVGWVKQEALEVI